MAKDNKKKDFRTSIGGQALIEGIMMRGPKKQAIVVRTRDGFVTKTEDLKLLKDKYPVVGWPFIRGIVNFASSMAGGVRALMFSAEQMPEDDTEGKPVDIPEKTSSPEETAGEKTRGEKSDKLLVTVSVILGVALSVGLFMLLPTFLAGLVSGLVESATLKNLIEGVIRIVIFLSYLWLVSRMKEMKRVWAYHGAEHKTIFCYEKGLELNTENVRSQSRLHPRCGTSFLFIVMIVSILVFSLASFRWNGVLVRVGLRLLLLPVVVSVSYEIIKLAGRYDNIVTRIISAPGRALQRLTTREPDDGMIETAIEALRLVIPENAADAKW